MKKFTLFIAALFIAGAANAQDMTSKRGVNILPEAGDISITMEANPFLNYVGTIMSADGAWGSMANVNFWNDGQYLQGRYFLDETKAVRAGLRIGFGSSTEKENVTDVNGDELTLEDKTSYNAIFLNAGIEFRRGKYGRFQGYYGAELLFGIQGAKEEDQSYDAVGDEVITATDKAGSTLTLGINGFIGVEYFFAPKVSVSGEFGWGFMLESTGDGEFDSGVDGVDPVTIPGSSAFMLDTNNSGALKLNFLF